MQKYVGPVEAATLFGALLVVIGVEHFSRPAAMALLILAGAAVLTLALVAVRQRTARRR